MHKWYVPLAVLGVGGLGVLLLSEGGRRRLHWALEQAHRAPETLQDWNDAAQQELDRIQSALNQVASSLAAAR